MLFLLNDMPLNCPAMHWFYYTIVCILFVPTTQIKLYLLSCCHDIIHNEHDQSRSEMPCVALPVILSAAKNLDVASEILRCAQNDRFIPVLVGKIHYGTSRINKRIISYVSAPHRLESRACRSARFIDRAYQPG